VNQQSPSPDELDEDGEPKAGPCHEPRLWVDDGWTAKVVKNSDDDGWAVEMTLDGESEPSLIGPWTMGRDKKNPKPLDSSAFFTLVKTANEVLRRHEQQLHAQLHKSLVISENDQRTTIYLDIVPEEDDPYGTLRACDHTGAELASVRVPPTFKLNADSARRWIADEFRRPG
jgi:hypothetical protein